MKPKSLLFIALCLFGNTPGAVAEGIMIDDFEHSHETYFGALRNKRFGYVTIHDEANGIFTGNRGGYLLNSAGESAGIGWDGHRLVYEGKDGRALVSFGYNRDSGRGIPVNPISFDGKPLAFSLANQKFMEILFTQCNLGEADGLEIHLEMGDVSKKRHTVTAVKYPGPGAVSIPLAGFEEQGLDLSQVLGFKIILGDSISPGEGLPMGTEFKIEHIRTIDTETQPDSDADGTPDVIEYVTGGDPMSAAPTENQMARRVFRLAGGELAYQVRLRSHLHDGVKVRIEVSSDLKRWSRDSAAMFVRSVTDLGNGFEERVVQLRSGTPHGFFRLAVRENGHL